MTLETNKFYKHSSGLCIVVTSANVSTPSGFEHLIEEAGDPWHTISSLPVDSPAIDEMVEITKEEWILAGKNAEWRMEK